MFDTDLEVMAPEIDTTGVNNLKVGLLPDVVCPCQIGAYMGFEANVNVAM
jgi:hypothetical protein